MIWLLSFRCPVEFLFHGATVHFFKVYKWTVRMMCLSSGHGLNLLRHNSLLWVRVSMHFLQISMHSHKYRWAFCPLGLIRIFQLLKPKAKNVTVRDYFGTILKARETFVLTYFWIFLFLDWTFPATINLGFNISNTLEVKLVDDWSMKFKDRIDRNRNWKGDRIWEIEAERLPKYRQKMKQKTIKIRARLDSTRPI